MSSFHWSRRSFVRAIGTSALAFPFYRLLERSAVGDAGGKQPQRFVSVWIPNGCPLEFWRPQPGFDIGHANSALQPFDDAATYGVSLKSKLVVIDGLDNKVANESKSGGHDAGPTILTASAVMSPKGRPQCESIDQFLAVTHGLGNPTLFPSVSFRGDIYGPSGQGLSGFDHPTTMFNTLFANFAAPKTQDPQAAANALARGKSSLDYTAGSITRLQGRLAAAERLKLDQHLTAIREIESRLQQIGAMGSLQCATPTPPSPASLPKIGAGDTIYSDYGDAINDAVNGILVEAIACDLTRFIAFRCWDPSADLASSPQDPGVEPAVPKINCGDPRGPTDCVHITVGHSYVRSSPFTLLGAGTQAQVTSQIRLARATKYYMSKLAAFAKGLNDYGALDSCAIITSSDVGNPALHDSINLPTLLIGSANGYFKTGQHLLLPNDDPNGDKKSKSLSAQNPHNALYVSICNAFGIPVNSFGVSSDPATTLGPLAGLKA